MNNRPKDPKTARNKNVLVIGGSGSGKTRYLEIAHSIGLNPELLHRIASISSGGLDTLPHNGAVLTLLAVSNCTHKDSYIDICVTTCIIPVIGSLLLALVWGVFL